MNTKNILIVGVGGQGIIFCSKVLAAGLLKAGYDVKMSEVHGMAQRGGSVSTHVCYGKKVYSPVISKGEADILVSFEKMEAMRYIDYLKPNGTALVNDFEIPPAPVLSGKTSYPDGIIDDLKLKVKVVTLDVASLVKQVGTPKAMNTIILGALIKLLELDDIDWNEVIREMVPPKAVDFNCKALKLGMTVS
jgi:indolepyruvate ferredoxin oxidoreductase beta subunit